MHVHVSVQGKTRLKKVMGFKEWEKLSQEKF